MRSATLLVLTWLALISLVNGGKIYDVANYGAVGDGETDNSEAFLKAWKEACADANEPTFILASEGKTYLTSNVDFSGPCKSGIQVKIIGNLVTPKGFWTKKQETWIIFKNIDGLRIDGGGSMEGRGATWWPCVSKRKCKGAPYTMEIMGCNDLQLNNLRFKNSPGKNLAIYKCSQVNIYDLTIKAPGNSPNTDGIMVAESSDVRIWSCNIGVGDDCITISNGCSSVNVSRITCGPGHGLSVGSLKENTRVEDIMISNSKVSGTLTGARIKTWQGGSGYAKNILFQDITFSAVKKPIEVSQFYCPGGGCANEPSAVALSQVTLRNLKGTSTQPIAITLDCSKNMPCTGIVMDDIDITYEGKGGAKSICNNAVGKIIGVVAPRLPCLGKKSEYHFTSARGFDLSENQDEQVEDSLTPTDEEIEI